MAVRGRHQYNKDTGEWGIHYRAYRDYWLLLLLTVNDRLFALQIPKVVPGKIRAQFEEQEELGEISASLKRGEITFKKPEGVDRRYKSIREEKQKAFVRNPDKIEASVKPEPFGTILIEASKREVLKAGIYEEIIN